MSAITWTVLVLIAWFIASKIFGGSGQGNKPRETIEIGPVARQGRFYYWVCNAVAIFLLVIGLNGLNSPNEEESAAGLGFVALAVLAHLVGRLMRWLLSGK